MFSITGSEFIHCCYLPVGGTMQREFNIFGPVYPDIHYHVDRTEVKQAIHGKMVSKN